MSNDRDRRGIVVVISGPSGVGKTTVCARLSQVTGYPQSISATTRRSRTGEIPNIDYQFMNKEAFESAQKQNMFLEWANVHDNYYGTLRGPVEEKLRQGHNVVLNIDIQGAAKIRKSGLRNVSFFLLPPSLEVLRSRIGRRGDEPADIERRMKAAEAEMSHQNEYDHQIVNDEIEKTVAQIIAILEKTRETAEG